MDWRFLLVIVERNAAPFHCGISDLRDVVCGRINSLAVIGSQSNTL
jgi:hypothetical protein